MTTKISFKDDEGCERSKNKSNIALSGLHLMSAARYLGLAFCDLIRMIDNKVIRRFPHAVIFVIITASIVFAYINIAKARTERDRLLHRLYIQEKKIEQYEIGLNKK